MTQNFKLLESVCKNFGAIFRASRSPDAERAGRGVDVPMTQFSGAVKLGDLNDFIAPSQACIVALEGARRPGRICAGCLPI